MTGKYDRGIEDIEKARMEEARFWSQRAAETGLNPYGTGAIAGSYSLGEPVWGMQPRVLNPQLAAYGPPQANFYSQPFVPGTLPLVVPPQTAQTASSPQSVPLPYAPYAQHPIHPALSASGQSPYWFYNAQPGWNVPPNPYTHPQLFGQPFFMNPNQPMGIHSPGIGNLEAQFGGWEGIAQRGPFYRQTSRAFGRPPRGYKRSDELIRDEICKRLTLTPELDATEVEVIVKDGEVTLRGVVDDRFAKRLVEDITETTFGVRDVLNEIRLGSRFQEQELSTMTKGKEK